MKTTTATLPAGPTRLNSDLCVGNTADLIRLHADDLAAVAKGELTAPTFVAAGVDAVERLQRRSLCTIAFGLDVALADAVGGLPAEPAKRRLIDVEATVVRLAAVKSDVTSVQVALMEGLAAPGELALVHAEHVAGDEVALAGGAGTGGVSIAPRTVTIHNWARPALARLCETRPTGPLLYGGRADDPADQTSAVLMSVGKVLSRAGLRHDPRVRPMSITKHAARRMFDEAPHHQIERVAEALGGASYDAVLRTIQL